MNREFINQIIAIEERAKQEKENAANNEQSIKPDAIEKSSIKKTSKFENDIEALKRKYGEDFKPGVSIEITLQELLKIAGRSRRRIEAYSGLVKNLQKQYNVTLIITSRKTKKQ